MRYRRLMVSSYIPTECSKTWLYYQSGFVHAISHPLIPPPPVFQILYLFPDHFSTLVRVVFQNKYHREIDVFSDVGHSTIWPHWLGRPSVFTWKRFGRWTSGDGVCANKPRISKTSKEAQIFPLLSIWSQSLEEAVAISYCSWSGIFLRQVPFRAYRLATCWLKQLQITPTTNVSKKSSSVLTSRN